MITQDYSMSTLWSHTRNYYYKLGMHIGNSVEPQSHDVGEQKSSIAISHRNTMFYIIFCPPFDIKN